MVEKKTKTGYWISTVSDFCLLSAAYLLAFGLRLILLRVPPKIMAQVIAPETLCVATLSALFIMALYFVMGLYDTAQPTMPHEMFYVWVADALGLMFTGTALYLFRMVDFSRLAILFFYLFSGCLICIRRFLSHKMAEARYASGQGQIRVLLVGAGRRAESYYQTILKNPQYGVVFLGYCAPKKNENLPDYLGGDDKIRPLLENHAVDEVVVALHDTRTEEIGSLVAMCGRFGTRICVIPAYNNYIPAIPKVSCVGELKMIAVRSAPDRGTAWRFGKRLADVVISFVALIVLSPLLLAAAIAVKVTSPGPVIFQQQRAGLDGKPFYMYKFRSMCVDAEKKLQELQQKNESDGPTFKMANDPRITKVGRFLRKTSIDELPQLINILRGEMSIVGPRPPLLSEVEQYNDWDWGRLAVKPGLTCYWQISGRSDLSFAEWMRLDLKYVEEQSFWTDFKIILRTVRVVFTGKGAY